jgi:hypothetical protein
VGLGLAGILSVILCSFAGCGKKADLSPVFVNSALVNEGPCILDDAERLTVSVINQGMRASKATTTTIEFQHHAPVRLPTRPLRPGQSTTVSFPIPIRCFRPDCSFKVVVDAKDEITESEEGNNARTGKCARLGHSISKQPE